jgi:hypothetical protein
MNEISKLGPDIDGALSIFQKRAESELIDLLEIQIRAPSYYSGSIIKDRIIFRSRRSSEGVWGPV